MYPLNKLYDAVVEVDERVTIETFAEDPEPQPVDITQDPQLRMGLTGEPVRIIKSPDLDMVRRDLHEPWNQGYRGIAVAMLHSYTFPQHELEVAQEARKFGFRVAASFELQSMAKLVPCSQSAVADAYLTPVTDEYLTKFRKGLKGNLEDEQAQKLFLNQSDGGLTSFTKFGGLRGILSGPAGGVVGIAKTCYDPISATPLLGFDMGGTSTDVARYAGSLEHIFESTIAEVTIQTPHLDINTVAEGGGSILSWENSLFKVGPSNARADPGPACYGRGGPLTVTDASFLLGRIIPELDARPLNLDIVKFKFTELTDAINKDKDGDVPLSIEDVALGFLCIANASMARPIRMLSEGRGFETSAHDLACFGGAGGQHAVEVAQALGIHRVLIPRYSSILSAYGMALADVVVENQEPDSSTFDPLAIKHLEDRLNRLQNQGLEGLISQGFSPEQVEHEMFLNMRYQGSDTALMVESRVTYLGSARHLSTATNKSLASHNRETYWWMM
ncbi:hypothetical protein LTR84_005168 [Exophiala bonariae]|uniref:Hydantoinase A/oxoprolinase domain-containing protein n=1 Tax=Exophiala bonariae TaxID=1690606 RepID=A0AAV9NRK5_9EURO|nr:hypothetical protein LTR84_005168 [Exophiala bonariae]